MHHAEPQSGDAPKPQFSMKSIEQITKSYIQHKKYPLFLSLLFLHRFQSDLLDFQSEWAGNGLELMATDVRTARAAAAGSPFF